MTEGLQVFNSDLSIQYDSNRHNMLLQTKGSMTPTSDAGTFSPSTVFTGTVSFTGLYPVIAFSSTQKTILFRVDNTGTSWTFHFVQPISAAAISYYIYDDANQLTVSENLGIETFDASGAVTFWSGGKPLKIITALNLTDPTITVDTPMITPVGSWTGTAGRLYALIQANMFYRKEKYSSPISHGALSPGNQWYDSRSIRGSVSLSAADPQVAGYSTSLLQLTFAQGAGGAVESFIHQYGDLAWLVADVTNQ